MSNLVFAGDSLLAGEKGYYPLLEAKIFLEHPTTPHFFYLIKKNCETFAEIESNSSGVLIGRAPKVIFLSLGTQDIYSNQPLEEVLKMSERTLSLLEDKTQAEIFISNVAVNLLKDSEYHSRCEGYNRGLAEISQTVPLNIIDIDKGVREYLETHLEGAGEKRPLHKMGPELYPMGQMLMAEIVFNEMKKKGSLLNE